MIFRSTQQTATVIDTIPRNITAIATASRITITLRSISSIPVPLSLPPSFPGFPVVDVGDVEGSIGCDVVGNVVLDGDRDMVCEVGVTEDSNITCVTISVAV